MIEKARKKAPYLAIWVTFLVLFFIPIPFIGFAIGAYYLIQARNYINKNLLIVLGLVLVIEQLIIYVPAIIFLLITG